MTFTAEQVEKLDAPLDGQYVKRRQASGRSFSYVEGWHVVAEANRIFGFDAWSSEVRDMRLVVEPPTLDGVLQTNYTGVDKDPEPPLRLHGGVRGARQDPRRRPVP